LNAIISVRFQNVSVAQALDQIAEKAGLNLVYGSERVAVEKRIEMEEEGVTAHEALGQVLEETGLRLRAFSEKRVVIEETETAPEVDPVKPNASSDVRSPHLEQAPTFPSMTDRRPVQTGAIAGTVADAQTGDPLPGVNVVVALGYLRSRRRAGSSSRATTRAS
jgi:hypothetical protein